VEEVRAVPVDLDPGLGLGLGVRVPAQVVPPVEHEDPPAQLGGHPFGHRQAEQSRADDDEIDIWRGHAWTVVETGPAASGYRDAVVTAHEVSRLP
jgi:hypothetical protein